MIGNNIKYLRKIKHMTQQQLADSLYVSQQTIAQWENNQTVPQSDRIIEIARILNVSPLRIICNTDRSGVCITYDKTKKIEEQIKGLENNISGPHLYCDEIALNYLTQKRNKRECQAQFHCSEIEYYSAMEVINDNSSVNDFIDLICSSRVSTIK